MDIHLLNGSCPGYIVVFPPDQLITGPGPMNGMAGIGLMDTDHASGFSPEMVHR